MGSCLHGKLDSLLQSDERVLWEGMPYSSKVLLYLGYSGLLIMLIGILAAIFSTPIIGILIAEFGFFVALIGFAMFFKYRSIRYAVTDRHVFIVERSVISSWPVRSISSLELRATRRNIGTIYINGFSWSRGHRCFLNIHNPHEVYRLINSLTGN